MGCLKSVIGSQAKKVEGYENIMRINRVGEKLVAVMLSVTRVLNLNKVILGICTTKAGLKIAHRR